ncbi:MAG: CPBP family intramembrane metalloprotease [Candidatus Methanoplasma sp.]|jgi:membrane protease YdiL (CAAX protease family)|nr:CPBP family intramembrane metalloprotease [Candidatus Methanoplasma sp.]
MSDECPDCENFKAEGSAFCGACGRPLAGKMSGKRDHGFVGMILLIVCSFVILILAFELLTIFVNSLDVFDFLSDKASGFILIVPFPQRIFSLEGAVLQTYWIIVIAIISSCAAYALYRFFGAFLSSGDAPKHDAAENTAVFWISVSLSAMMLISFAVVFIMALFGYEATVPSFGDKTEQMFLLADAAVWEEVITRLLYIGVPMTLISLAVTGKKESLKCLFGGFGMSTAAAVFIIISGAIFGLAHYPGWEDQAWKVLTAAIMGIFLGYIFVRFGLYATILLHFINNYLSSFDWMGIGGFGIVVSLCLIAAGLAALYYILVRISESKELIDTLPIFRNRYTENR